MITYPNNNTTKYFAITIAILLAIVIASLIYSNIVEKNRILTIKNRHCNLIWKNLNQLEKNKILNEYIQNRIELDKILRQNTYSRDQSSELFIFLEIYEKYNFVENNIIIGNSTVPYKIFRFEKKDAKIIDIDKGLIAYSKVLIIKDRNIIHKLTATIKYSAECKKEELLDLQIK